MSPSPGFGFIVNNETVKRTEKLIMEKTKAIGRFIVSLVVLGGIIWFLYWVNTKDDRPAVQKSTEEQKEEKCAGGPATIEHGAVLEYANTDAYPKKGEMATFEGYVQMPNLTYLNSGTYLVNLVSDSANKVILMIWEGNCENTMKPIPDDYEDKDLLILDNGGKEIKHGDKVRVTGKVKDDNIMYMLFVRRIEKM
jgi:hypothetical protein